jgi:uncharacterized protein YdiU (UPF0061 family)
LAEAATHGEEAGFRAVFGPVFGLEEWLVRWRARLALEQRASDAVAVGMNAVNPAVIPRNHRVEEALAAASAETPDLAPFERLLNVLGRPFNPSGDLDGLDQPAPKGGAPYRTFCGT